VVPESVKALAGGALLDTGGSVRRGRERVQQHPREIPGGKEKVVSAREHLKGLRFLQQVEAIELANQARQHTRAQRLLEGFPRQDAEDGLLARARTLRAKYETLTETLKQAARLLDGLGSQTSGQTIARGGGHDSRRAEPRQRKPARSLPRTRSTGGTRPRPKEAHRKNTEQLLALAIDRMVARKDAAEPKVDNALHLWSARRFVLEYLKTDDADVREKLLGDYQRKPKRPSLR